MNGLIPRGGYLPAFLERFWNDALTERPSETALPAVNVKESPAAFTLDVSMPGFAQKDVSVDVDGDTLTITAGREEDREEKDKENRVLRQEFRASSFSRSFTVPLNVDTENIAGKLDHGVLTLTLPKKNNAPENKKKKIAIK